MERPSAIAIAVASIAALVAAGRWLLTRLFDLLAASKAREVMTAAALLLVLVRRSPYPGGLSMAMGAFWAASELSFRHQLEADVEPFRGVLLGLFFLGVSGMSLDSDGRSLRTGPYCSWRRRGYGGEKPRHLWSSAGSAVPAFRVLERAALMAQGGEFAFMPRPRTRGPHDGTTNAVLPRPSYSQWRSPPLTSHCVRPAWTQGSLSLAAVEFFLSGRQHFDRRLRFFSLLISQGCSPVSIIDANADNIRLAEEFGFKVYYGDGRRRTCRAAGAEMARANPDLHRSLPKWPSASQRSPKRSSR